MSGKSGCSGGARKGAGRKARPVAKLTVAAKDPLAFLLGVMADQEVAPALRIRSAIAAAQYLHVKKGDGGIKDGQRDKAKAAGKGFFAPGAAPTLKLIPGA